MFVKIANTEKVQLEYPGAYAYIRVKGGYMVFYWPSEYAEWKRAR